MLQHDELWGHYAKKEASHEKMNTVGFHLQVVPRVVCFTGTESGMLAARGWGLGAGEEGGVV